MFMYWFWNSKSFCSTVKGRIQFLKVMIIYLRDLFCGKRDLVRFVAKDIQSRCRNLREMKDVFKELKVLGRKRKSCTAQISKDILETIFTSTSTFSSRF